MMLQQREVKASLFRGSLKHHVDPLPRLRTSKMSAKALELEAMLQYRVSRVGVFNRISQYRISSTAGGVIWSWQCLFFSKYNSSPRALDPSLRMRIIIITRGPWRH